MTADVLDSPTRELERVNGRGVPVQRIDALAADIDFGRGVKRLVAAAIYYPARFVGSLVSGLGWAVAAWKVGYRDGRRRLAVERQVSQQAPDRTTR